MATRLPALGETGNIAAGGAAPAAAHHVSKELARMHDPNLAPAAPYAPTAPPPGRAAIPLRQAAAGDSPVRLPPGAARERSIGLDIVRAAAITLVLVSHCGDMFAAWFGGKSWPAASAAGFFGVELFFALSGFLIGRLLLEIADGRPDFRAWLVFMIRRWMRTLPLYFLWLGVLVLIWRPQFWVPGDRALWHDLPWFATLTQNFAWPMVDSWFDVSWSLTVEEWFYLLFSVLLIGGTVLAGRRIAFWTTLLAFLLIPPLLRWHVPVDVDWDSAIRKVAAYRLDAIAFGVVVAWMSVRQVRLLDHPGALLFAGLVLIGFVWVGSLHWRPYFVKSHVCRTFVFDVASLGFAMCLPAAIRLKNAPAWISRPARALSLQSYGIYIMHLSLLEMIDACGKAMHLPPASRVVVALIAILGLPWLSYHYFEAPILRHRPRQHRGDNPAALWPR